MRWLLLAMVGCGTPEGRADRDGTPTGGISSTPPANSGLVWVDAAGEEVPGIVVLPEGIRQGAPLDYVDEDGNFWPLDPLESGAVAFIGSEEAYPANPNWKENYLRSVYSDAACKVPWVWWPHRPLPGVVLMISTSASGNQDDVSDLNTHAYVVPEDLPTQALDPTYELHDGECSSEGTHATAAVGDLLEVQPPATWWTPPLRPAYR